MKIFSRCQGVDYIEKTCSPGEPKKCGKVRFFVKKLHFFLPEWTFIENVGGYIIVVDDVKRRDGCIL